MSDWNSTEYAPCPLCEVKIGAYVLCPSCLHNRGLGTQLCKALREEKLAQQEAARWFEMVAELCREFKTHPSKLLDTILGSDKWQVVGKTTGAVDVGIEWKLATGDGSGET